MSYVRFGEDGSQVYIYEDVAGYVKCCFCSLNPDWKNRADFHTTELEAMLAHVDEHRARGDVIPEYAVDEMRIDWPSFAEGGGT